ncbi:hypothetical protein G3T36_17490 [Diaminobutyricibacter tongyongensis]|uniref:DUF4913 domain-containing protein n=1 Tax=Leifsonia tongyongensis TaxID=1268043 RepID=A0A6L9Y1T0_9MICO|nr:hypothetical protein [Diaminobutyricibacter tongyongensis]NEN07652.1 hypothetical protein [Diaminobutyricibacter tongyongensis]
MSGDETPIEDLLDTLPENWDAQLPRRSPGMLGISVINWRALTKDEAPEIWTELGEWVDWFIRRYNLPTRKIPPCWYKHGALVEELSALHAAWLVSFDNLDAGYGPIGWHERLAVAIPRLAGWYNGECHNGHTELPQGSDHYEPRDWPDWIASSHAE